MRLVLLIIENLLCMFLLDLILQVGGQFCCDQANGGRFGNYPSIQEHDYEIYELTNLTKTYFLSEEISPFSFDPLALLQTHVALYPFI